MSHAKYYYIHACPQLTTELSTMDIGMTIEWASKIQGADIQSKVEELEELNQALKNHD